MAPVRAAERAAASAKPSMPITPGSTGMPSMRWSSRKALARRVELGAARSARRRRVDAVASVIGPRVARPLAGASASSPPVAWRSSSRTPSAPGDDHLAAARRASISRRTDGHADRRREHRRSRPSPSSSGSSRGVAMPISPQAVQSIAMPRVSAAAAQAGDRSCTAGRWRRCSRSGRRCRSGPAIELKATAVPSGLSRSACRRLNQPSALTSKTRSYSACGLSGRKWLISSPAAWISTSTRPRSTHRASASLDRARRR